MNTRNRAESKGPVSLRMAGKQPHAEPERDSNIDPEVDALFICYSFNPPNTHRKPRKVLEGRHRNCNLVTSHR